MKKYVAVLGRQPLISLAEIEALYGEKCQVLARSFDKPWLAEFATVVQPNLARMGGTMKLAEEVTIDELIKNLPNDGKITLGVSDFTRKASAYQAQKEALKLKKILVAKGRSVRVVANQTAVLSNAVSLHNGLARSAQKIELLKLGSRFFRVLQVSDIEAYARRDQKRPARDAKVGMLPPKLAQILINLCGDLPEGKRLLDPFCGTGVVLQEAKLMGYQTYGTDKSERMVEYTTRNLTWLGGDTGLVEAGDATDHTWTTPIDAVACETYLGPPMSTPPAMIKLKEVKQECRSIILGFLKNLAEQIPSGTPVVIAVPAWLRPNGEYSRLFGEKWVDEMENLRYNVKSFKNMGQSDLLYHRSGQIVAREIIVLRKK